MTQIEFKFMWSAASESIRKGSYFEFELAHLFLLVLHAWFSWELQLWTGVDSDAELHMSRTKRINVYT